VHEIESVARKFELDGKWLSLLKSLVDFNGSFSDAVALIEKTASSDGVASALSELSAIGELVANSALADRVKIDFSAVSNINYYNGIVFSGYVEGIADRILAGGEYSGLLSSMNRSGRAVGFAIYLDLLERLDTECEPYDVDVLLVYSDKTPIKTLFDTRAALTAEGKSVSAHNSSDVKVRYKDIVDIS
jgi:ATP phosphoribosyltransferase regulatory subunit